MVTFIYFLPSSIWMIYLPNNRLLRTSLTRRRRGLTFEFMKMKYIAILLISALVPAVYAADLGLTTNIINIEPQDGGKTGRVYKEDIFRGPDRIYSLIKRDMDLDGTFEQIHELFIYKGNLALSLSHSSTKALQTAGTVWVFFEDSDKDGTRDTILLIGKDLTLLEKYTLDSATQYFRPTASSVRRVIGDPTAKSFEADYLEMGSPEIWKKEFEQAVPAYGAQSAPSAEP